VCLGIKITKRDLLTVLAQFSSIIITSIYLMTNRLLDGDDDADDEFLFFKTGI
jgi:hypothetical protein